MAEITIPAGLIIEAVSLSLEWPGQRNFQSIFTRATQTLSRGVGRFVGEARLAGTSQSVDDGQRHNVEAFFAATGGQENTFRMTLPLAPRNELGPILFLPPSAHNAAVGGNRVEIEVARPPAGSFQAGDYLEIGDRLFIVIAGLAGGRATLAPGVPIADGAAIEVFAPRIWARRSSAAPILPSASGDFIGPWNFNFEEVVD